LRAHEISSVLLTLVLLQGTASGEGRPVVAVFEIEAAGATVKPAVRANLTRYLATKLAESGVYDVVPPDKVKEALTARKKESYKQCFDQSCQIEIGRELAASKSLATQLMKVGSKCVVTSNLYDLRKSTTERAASGKGACDEDEIMTTIEEVVRKLSALRLATEAPAPAPAPPPAPPPAPAAPSRPAPPISEVYFVDLRPAMAATKAGKKAKQELKQLFDRSQAELNARQAELKAAQASSTPDAKKLAQAKFTALQRLYVARQKELSDREAALTAPLAKGLTTLVERSNREAGRGIILNIAQYAGVLADPTACDQSAWLAASYDRGALLPLQHRAACRFAGALFVEPSKILGQTKEGQALEQQLKKKRDELQGILDRENQRLRSLAKEQRERELIEVQKKYLAFQKELQSLKTSQMQAIDQRFRERLRKAAAGSRAILIWKQPEAGPAPLAITPSCDATGWAIRVLNGLAAPDELRRFCPAVAL
jgi:Skp family chaperone for outer membrane proteins